MKKIFSYLCFIKTISLHLFLMFAQLFNHSHLRNNTEYGYLNVPCNSLFKLYFILPPTMAAHLNGKDRKYIAKLVLTFTKFSRVVVALFLRFLNILTTKRPFGAFYLEVCSYCNTFSVISTNK